LNKYHIISYHIVYLIISYHISYQNHATERDEFGPFHCNPFLSKSS
jgi:hypothetical protein